MIAFDSGYSNTVTGGTNSVTIRKVVAVWNNPSSQIPTPTAAQQTRRYVVSWE